MHVRRSIVFSASLSIVIGLVALAVACAGVSSRAATAPAADELAVVEEAYAVILRDHIDRQNLDPQILQQAAIRGMIEALHDPHTGYISPDRYSVGRADLTGVFEGIGAQVGVRSGAVTIIAPLADSPAEQAGIRSGDVIVAVDGVAVDGKNLLEIVSLIRGPHGSPVTLTVVHAGSASSDDVQIVRDRIDLESVYAQMLDDEIGHLRITYFSERTPTELKRALKNLKNQGATKLVLDMRGNPGGYLDASVRVASEFLSKGIVTIEANAEGDDRVWNARPGGDALDTPLVVLVDEGSASGSEVTAAALQDHGRAPLLGMKTFGKGSINVARELSDGSALFVTTARWLTPDGRQIEGEGLTPDFEVSQLPSDLRSEQALVAGIAVRLQRLSALGEGQLRALSQDVQDVVDARLRALNAPVGEFADPQLEAAVAMLRDPGFARR